MELTYLPEEKTYKRTYKHFTINSQATAEATETKKPEFFYIGKKSGNIDYLISSFESGYAAESTSNAKSMLKRLISNSKSVSLPDIIIAEATIGGDALREFHQFLASHSILAIIPFVVEGGELQAYEIARFKKYSFIDDIIFLKDYSKQNLARKVDFLKRIKKRFVQESIARFIETSAKKAAGSSFYVKRSFDILISSALLLGFGPLFLLIALAIKMESKGPVFYIAKRAGRGYKIFDFFKFRTMQAGSDEKIKEMAHMNQYNTGVDGPVFIKINNDPRITRVGYFLRKTSLDELPQFVNVLLGDMSLVGNRPLPLYEAASLTTDEWAKRFMAPAGITGLWQIKKRGKKEMSIEERINLDINYANKYNFLYDLWIMANTPSALIQKTNS
jgi:lipopolysaccharide/colanic/teichoic acid biosynthesis glycosyltransferase